MEASTQPNTVLRPKNILLGITGSVAAIKGPELAVRLAATANVRILLTQGGASFWSKAKAYNATAWNEMTELCQPTAETNIRKTNKTDMAWGRISIISATAEWEGWNQIGDSVLHIDLRDWADIFVISPLSAHTLSKIAHGLCDDTLSCVARAWDFGHGARCGKPLLLAPAMNTAMWEHPLTQAHLRTIEGFWNVARSSKSGVHVVEPQVKTLACGEVGNGAMASVEHIVMQVEKALEED